VKVIASLGPSSSNIDVIERMVRAGANAFRINFAHGDPEQWAKFVDMVRTVEARLGVPLALIGDLRGPSIRIGLLERPILLNRGDVVRFVYAEQIKGDECAVPIPTKHFFEIVEVGDVIVMDDGKVRLRVVEKVGPEEIEAVAMTDARITSHKAVVIRGKDYELPTLSKDDLVSLEFALEHDFDYISLSYVRRPEDVELLRSILAKKGRSDVGVIAKIETKSAVENLEKIADNADVVMVARGDLGMNFNLEDIHFLQKYIVAKCLRKGKPVIVATQLLESMIENTVPTRAEVVDISVAVEQGVDALMLTGETSIGKHPVEAVSWLRRIADHVESRMDRELELVIERARSRPMDIATRFAKGVVELAEDIGAKLVIFTMKGNTAKRIASLRPRIRVFAATPSIQVMRKLSILWSLEPFYVEAENYKEGLEKALEVARSKGYVSIGDLVVRTYGLREAEHVIEVTRIE